MSLTDTDKLEILDFVRRKGPINYRDIVSKTSWASPDEVYSALKWGVAEGSISANESNGGTVYEWKCWPDEAEEATSQQ